MSSVTPAIATPAAPRLIGLDIARGLALIGMVMVHFGPVGAAGVWGDIYALPRGRASLLFVVVAGVGIALLTARPETRWLARARLMWFAILLLPLGLWLQSLDHTIAVIVQHYAVYFLFGALICGLLRQALLAVALVATVVGPMLYLFGRTISLALFSRQAVSLGDTPLEIVQGLISAGPYPLLTWAGPVAFGMFLGRLDLRSAGVRWGMIGLGIGAALAAVPLSWLGELIAGTPEGSRDWRMIFSAAAHSQMPLWLVNGMGLAAGIIGGALVLGDRIGRWLWPLALLGRFSLSIYVAHILLFVARPGLVQQQDPVYALISLTVFMATALAAAVLWERFLGRRGPLEWVLHAPWDWVRARRAKVA